MANTYQCWKCGSELDNLIMPLSRRQECGLCNADLHVCNMCVDYNPTISGQCNEDRAEDVSDKERANFCDYFKPVNQAFRHDHTDKQQAAKAKLEALFGDAKEETPEYSFSQNQNPSESPIDKHAKAKQALDDLFNKN